MNILLLSPGFVSMAGARSPGQMKMYASHAVAAHLRAQGHHVAIMEQANWNPSWPAQPSRVDLVLADATLLTTTPCYAQVLAQVAQRYPSAEKLWFGNGDGAYLEQQGFTHYEISPLRSLILKESAYHETENIYTGDLVAGEHVAYTLYRGCRFRCNYCDVPTKGAKKGGWDEARIRADFSRFAQEKVGGIEMVDFALNDFREKFDIFLRAWHDLLPSDTVLSCQVRMDQIREPDLHALLAAGLVQITAGVESHLTSAAKVLGKPTGKVVLDRFKRLRELAGDRVLIGATFMVGDPFCTLEEARNLVDWLLSPEGRALIDVPAVNVLAITTPAMAKMHGIEVPANQIFWAKPIREHAAYQEIVDRLYTTFDSERPGFSRLDQFSVLPLANEMGCSVHEVVKAIRSWDFSAGKRPEFLP